MNKLAGTVFLLSLVGGGALAQPMMPPGAAATAAVAAEQRAAIRSDVQSARAQARVSNATREQVQAIRTALRARLSALHH